MDRSKFLQGFARRLNQLMTEGGFDSNRSKTGVDTSKLAKVSECSYQMARKYTLGQALPELHVVVKIATWLKTSPSWLLFGENETQLSSKKSGSIIEIEPALLKYILKQSHVLFGLTSNIDDVINFIVDTVYDATHLNSDSKTIHKIIDMMISSATLLKNRERDAVPHASVS